MIISYTVTVLKYLGPTLLLVALLYEYRLQFLSPSRDSAAHRKASFIRCIIVAVAGMAGITASIFDDIEHSQKERDDRIYRGEQTTRENAILQEVTAVATRQGGLDSKYNNILTLVATQRAPNPALLDALAEIKEMRSEIKTDIVDLEAWKSNLQATEGAEALRNEAFRMRAAEDEKVMIVPYYRNWKYAMDKYYSILESIGSQHDKELLTTYQRFPSIDDICRGHIDSDEWVGYDIEVGTFQFKSDANWSSLCKIQRLKRMTEGARAADKRLWPRLFIYCTGAHGTSTLEILASVANLNIRGQQYTKQIPENGYEAVLDALLQSLVAAEADVLANL